MNVVNLYDSTGALRARVRIPKHMGIGSLDRYHETRGLTNRRPSSIKPHRWMEQQPGYHQPSEQARRRVRQAALRRAA
jgi:hypothetical protein